MITVASPAFLVAGGLLAAVPVVLHLLARRPPDRTALPTARFLAPDPRTLLRIRRTPSDWPLLLARTLFALALGAAFAGMRWVPEREGSRQVILVDAGADSLVGWEALADAVGQAAGIAAGPGGSGPGTDESPLVIAYGLDDGPAVVTVEGLRELTRGSSPATLEDGLRALRHETGAARFMEAGVTWVGRPSWRIWSPAIGLLRPALWPGRIELRAVDPGEGTGPPTPAPAAPLAQIAVRTSEASVRRALAALGVGIEGATGADGTITADWIVAELDPARGLASWLPRIREGATVLVFGESPSDSPDLPWVATSAPDREPALLVLPGDQAVGGIVPRVAGRPGPGDRTLLTFDDGLPAAAARELGEGCVVFLAAPLTHPSLTDSPAYPELLSALFDGCREVDLGDEPLDRGAVEILERPDLPPTVEAASVVGSEGRSWTRWFLLAALALLGTEVLLTRSRKPGR